MIIWRDLAILVVVGSAVLAGLTALFGPYDFFDQFLSAMAALVSLGATTTLGFLAGGYLGKRFNLELMGAVAGLLAGLALWYFGWELVAQI